LLLELQFFKLNLPPHVSYNQISLIVCNNEQEYPYVTLGNFLLFKIDVVLPNNSAGLYQGFA